jgi:hypothetical protein
MRRLLIESCIAALGVAIVVAGPAFTQDAASVARSNSAAADQPAEPQGHTVIIGCLSGPDAKGKFTLRSMTYRTGVEVVGPDDLKTDAGGKVKLTGLWKPGDQSADGSSAKKARRFQATTVEVMAAKCDAPSEKTPVSKEKQQRQQQKQKTNSNPPAS